jgi:hypothetical protein
MIQSMALPLRTTIVTHDLELAQSMRHCMRENRQWTHAGYDWHIVEYRCDMGVTGRYSTFTFILERDDA